MVLDQFQPLKVSSRAVNLSGTVGVNIWKIQLDKTKKFREVFIFLRMVPEVGVNREVTYKICVVRVVPTKLNIIWKNVCVQKYMSSHTELFSTNITLRTILW